MPTYEGLRLKLLKYNRKLFGNIHQKKIKNKNFTIISNNCWAGEVYEYYNLQKQSPTIGMFFMAEDYVRFIKRLKEYVYAPLVFIDPKDSKWVDESIIINDKRFGTYPIGKLLLDDEDVEIFFLHYHSQEEAADKWYRRCKRINWDKMIIKFNDQNGCTEDHINMFFSQKYSHMIFFTVKEWNTNKNKNNIFIFRQGIKRDYIMASYEPFGNNRYCNINDIINCL